MTAVTLLIVIFVFILFNFLISYFLERSNHPSKSKVSKLYFARLRCDHFELRTAYEACMERELGEPLVDFLTS